MRAAIHRPAKFAGVGVVNTAVDLALYWGLITFFGLHPVVANTCSYGAGLVNSYVLNRVWTFGDSRHYPVNRAAQFARFAAFNLIGLALSNLVVWMLSPSLSPLGAKLIAVLATFAWNYWTSRKFVYHGGPASAI